MFVNHCNICILNKACTVMLRLTDFYKRKNGTRRSTVASPNYSLILPPIRIIECKGHVFNYPFYNLCMFFLHSADGSSDGSLERFKQQIKVDSDGNNLWLAPIILLSSCKIYVKYFPFDEQHCELKFGSWTYDGFHMDLVKEADEAESAKFSKNGEWELVGVPCKRNVIKYVCCDAPYPDVTYTVKIRRRTLFFFFNMIIPCLVIVGKKLWLTKNRQFRDYLSMFMSAEIWSKLK